MSGIDYSMHSMLLKGIEDNFAGAISSPYSTVDSVDLSLVENSTSKRKRLSVYSPGSVNTETTNYGDLAKLTSIVDVLKLKNEQLNDRLKITIDEHSREKERLLRQVEFLDEENSKLRKSEEEKRERYYDEKKKWMQKQRSLEKELEKAFKATSRPSEAGDGISSSAAVSAPKVDTTLVKSYAELEEKVRKASDERQSLAKKNTELEEVKRHLEIEVATLRSTSIPASDDANEMRELRKRCSALQDDLRRANRENERNQGKLKNQILLEEDNNAIKNKVKALEAIAAKVQSQEANLRTLQNEKDEWTSLFKEVLSGKCKPSDLTPIGAVRHLSTLQKSFAVLSREQSELESKNADLKKKAISLETSLKDSEKQRTDAVNAFERSEQKLKLSQQQTSRYEKEVKSLRALLQTFDAEFKIGKPSAEALVASKDEMIEQLRVILDESRAQLKVLMEKSFDSEGKSTITPQVAQSTAADAVQLQSHKEEVRQLKFQLQRLKDELFGLQKATGLDYVPSQTRVLHLIQNPAAGAGASKSSSGPGKTFATQIEELRYLREETKRLQELVLHRTDDIDSSDGKDNSSSSKLALETSMAPGVNSSTIIADPEKVNQRLKETFKERITCFREAVYLLTGFKIDLISSDVGSGGHPMLRLRSMYAEDPDDCLLFRWRGLSTLELMDTPFAKKLDSRLFSILASSNSVPHFLSNVTQELFENQTFMG